MKKSLMILACVALGASMSVGQDVESKNIVGYNTTTFPSNKYTALGWQFALVGGATNIPIASITNYPNPTRALGSGGSDMIRRFDTLNSVWVDYYNRTTGWRILPANVPTTDSLKVGEMVMFYKRTINSDFSQSGEVPDLNFTVNLASNKYTAMCNPYPVVMDIASITNYTNPTKALGSGGSDMIRRFDTATQTWKDYYNRTTGWRVLPANVATTDSISVGEGFMFFKRTVDGVMTFTSPIL